LTRRLIVVPSKALRSLVAVGAAALALTGGQAFAASPAVTAHHTAAHPAAVTVLTYDASGAGEFASAVTQGAAVWNSSVTNVRLQPVQAGKRANFKIVAYDGWPETSTTSVGNGTIFYGREAVDEGYNTVRIASHEMGHILGLPDAKPGPCSSLMSGSTGGVSCTNVSPNASEKAAVERNFSSGFAAQARTGRTVVFRD
jgi:snapalysin